MAQALTRVLCVGHSRLRHLQPLLNNNQRNISFNCFVFPGATLGHLSFQLRSLLQQNDTHYAYVVVMGGICDLTIQTREPHKRLTPAYSSVSAMVENFERVFALFRESSSLYMNVPIIYIPVVGVHLMKYSGNDDSVFCYQPVIDQSIPLINIIIKRTNKLNGLPTPEIANTIHHCHGRRGRYRTRYSRLFDGCHPDSDTQLLWTREILKIITNLVYF